MSGKRKHKSGNQKCHEQKEREARRVVVSQSIKTFLKTGCIVISLGIRRIALHYASDLPADDVFITSIKHE